MNGFQRTIQLHVFANESITSTKATIIPWSSLRKRSLVRLARRRSWVPVRECPRGTSLVYGGGRWF